MRHVYTAAEPCQDLARKYTAREWQKSELFAARDAPEGTAYRSCRRPADEKWRLKDNLRRHLKLPVRNQRGVDVAESCRPEYGRRIGKRRRIEDIEELEAQLQASPLS